MERPDRIQAGGLASTLLNRAIARGEFSSDAGDYTTFCWVLADAQSEHPMCLLFSSIMANHYHQVVLPKCDTILSRFFGRRTHTQRRLDY